MSWDAMTCCLTSARPYRIACTLVALGCASWRWPALSHSCVVCAAWGARLSVAVVVDIGGEGRVDHFVCICEQVSIRNRVWICVVLYEGASKHAHPTNQ